MALIGEKNIFAIEFEITDSRSIRGNVCLWINSIKVGNYNEVVYLNYISDSLNNILSKRGRLLFKELENVADEELLEVLLQSNTPDEEKLIKYDITIVHLGESFDYYIIRVIEKDSGFMFYWKSANDINAKVFSGFVPNDVMSTVYLDYMKKVFSK